jgi:hypothetical protein
MCKTLATEDQQRIDTLNGTEQSSTEPLIASPSYRIESGWMDGTYSVSDEPTHFRLVQLFQSCFLPPYPMHAPWGTKTRQFSSRSSNLHMIQLWWPIDKLFFWLSDLDKCKNGQIFVVFRKYRSGNATVCRQMTYQKMRYVGANFLRR